MDAPRRIVLFWVGEDIEIPQMLVRSIRAAYRDEIEIVQLSDKATPKVSGVSIYRRLKLSSRIMVARLEAYAGFSVKEPTLYLDADMLVLKRFELPVIAQNEIGVTRRHPSDAGLINWRYPIDFPEFEGKTFMDEMPYIYSFVYANSELIFVRQLNALLKMPKRFQQWYGDQVTLKRELDGDRFLIRDLDTAIFNRTVRPAIEFREIKALSPEVCIVHFKGQQSKAEMSLSIDNLLG